MKNNSYLNSTSLLGETMVINGDIECGGDMRIDGKILGNISCTGKLIVGNNANINGNIEAGVLDISGTVNGNAKILEALSLRSGSALTGDINLVSASLHIEESAVFNGVCSMVLK